MKLARNIGFRKCERLPASDIGSNPVNPVDALNKLTAEWQETAEPRKVAVGGTGIDVWAFSECGARKRFEFFPK
jgi:hypothetical protein